MNYWIQRTKNNKRYYIKDITGMQSISAQGNTIHWNKDRIWTTNFDDKFMMETHEIAEETKKNWCADVDCFVTNIKGGSLVETLPGANSGVWTDTSKWSLTP